MDKIKKVLSPGASKDDEVMYGDPEARLRASREHPRQESYNDSSNFGHDPGLVGAAGLAGAGAGAAGTRSSESSELGRSASANHPPGQRLDCDGTPAQGYVHHTSGPHSADIANQLDPHVGAGPPLSPTTARAQPSHGAQAGNNSHLGRDAAVVGGAGAAGAGAYTATRDTNAATTRGFGVHDPSSTGLAHSSTTYGGTNPAIDQKHSHHTTGGHTTYGGTDPALERKHDRKLQHTREEQAEQGGDHGEKKSGLIHKILHPRGHGKDEKDFDDKHHSDKHHSDKHHSDKHHSETRDVQASRDVGGVSSEAHEHTHPKTSIDETGRNKLHKDPPLTHPAAQAQAAVAGPDWDAVNQSNRTF